MSLTPFDALPDESRLWIFGTDRPPEAGEADRLLDATGGFLEEWAAHRRQLDAGYDWAHDRFLHVGVDESGAAASGCSIDALVAHLQGLEQELGLSLVDTSPVWYRDPADGESIRCVERDTFRELAREDAVDGGTIVFDLTVDTVGAVRSGAWERPAADAWHAALLPEETSGTARRAG